MAEVITITSREQLAEFAREHKLRDDWHEPDEQGINAIVVGTHLDNANCSPPKDGWDTPQEASVEFGVYLVDDETQQPLAFVNLALLLAFATGTCEGA